MFHISKGHLHFQVLMGNFVVVDSFNFLIYLSSFI